MVHDARTEFVLKSAKRGDGLEQDGFLKRVGFESKLGLSKLATVNATNAHELGRRTGGSLVHLNGLV